MVIDSNTRRTTNNVLRTSSLNFGKFIRIILVRLSSRTAMEGFDGDALLGNYIILLEIPLSFLFSSINFASTTKPFFNNLRGKISLDVDDSKIQLDDDIESITGKSNATVTSTSPTLTSGPDDEKDKNDNNDYHDDDYIGDDDDDDDDSESESNVGYNSEDSYSTDTSTSMRFLRSSDPETHRYRKRRRRGSGETVKEHSKRQRDKRKASLQELERVAKFLSQEHIKNVQLAEQKFDLSRQKGTPTSIM